VEEFTTEEAGSFKEEGNSTVEEEEVLIKCRKQTLA